MAWGGTTPPTVGSAQASLRTWSMSAAVKLYLLAISGTGMSGLSMNGTCAATATVTACRCRRANSASMVTSQMRTTRPSREAWR